MAEAKKLPSGSWRVLLYTGTDAAGKRKYSSFTAPTKKEAEFLAAEYRFKHESEIHTHMTLKDALEGYIDLKEAVLSPTTLRSYRSICRNHLKGIMNVNLRDLKNEQLQRAISIEAKTCSPKTVRNINGLLVSAITTFRPEFTPNIRLPQKEKKEFFMPDEDTVNRLYEKAKGRKIELPLLLASQLGLRASEIAGLTYECVDRNKKRITIKQARVYSEHGDVMKQPKSYAGNRTLPCPDHILEKIGEGEKDELIMKTSSNQITRMWRFFMEKSGEEYFNFHALRHYFCSVSLLLGAPKKYVAELMGHSSENMINQVYEHTFGDKKQEYAEMITSYFSSRSTHKNTPDAT